MISYMGSSRSSQMKYFRKLLKDFENACTEKESDLRVYGCVFSQTEHHYKEAKRKLISYFGSRI